MNETRKQDVTGFNIPQEVADRLKICCFCDGSMKPAGDILRCDSCGAVAGIRIDSTGKRYAYWNKDGNRGDNHCLDWAQQF